MAVELHRGNPVMADADALVVPVDSTLWFDGFVGESLRAFAGAAFQNEALRAAPKAVRSVHPMDPVALGLRRVYLAVVRAAPDAGEDDYVAVGHALQQAIQEGHTRIALAFPAKSPEQHPNVAALLAAIIAAWPADKTLMLFAYTDSEYHVLRQITDTASSPTDVAEDTATRAESSEQNRPRTRGRPPKRV